MADASGGFRFVPVPIGKYRAATFPDLDAEDQAAEVGTLLGGIGGAEQPWSSAERDLSAVFARLRSWSHPEPPPAPGAGSLLYWVGHGQALGPKAWLAVADSPDPMAEGGAVNPESFAEHVIAEWRHRSVDEDAWALVVVEACGAKRFVEILLSRLYAEGGLDRLAVIGVSAGDGASFLGDFRQVLSEALDSYSDNDETVSLRDLVARVQDRLGDRGQVGDLGIWRARPLPRRRRSTGPVTAPLDVYAELQSFIAGLAPDERGHFLPKAQGAEPGELAWYFVGRRAESARIARWLREARSGMLVVTGEAGSGKSALLGNVVVQSNPELRALLLRAGLVAEQTAEEAPPPRVFDAVLHLTGATTDEVVQRLADAVGVTGGATPEELLQQLTNRQQPLTVLLDALDEAQEPLVVAQRILARAAELPAVRLVVGTRTSTLEGPDSPAGDDTDLLDALGGPRNTLLTVRRDRTAVAEYLRRRLSAAFPAGDRAELALACGEITDHDRQFLYARLAAHELIAQPELLTPAGRARRADLLAHDYRALFASAADRLYRRNPAYAPLLEALALARGRGLPRADEVWATAARALTDGHIAIGEAEVDALLADAAPYLMLDAEHGQSVYRLAHRTFQEFYQAPWSGERHHLITCALAAAATGPGEPNPYLVHHLAAHAWEGDSWWVLARNPRLLDHLDPTGVAAQASRYRPDRARLPDTIAAIRAAHHHLSPLPPPERARLRAVAEAQLSGGLPPESDWRWGEACWRPLWADFHRTRPASTSVTIDCEQVTAMAPVRSPGGRTLLALGDNRGLVRLWDADRGIRVGEPWQTGAHHVQALAAVPGPQGHDLVAVADGSTVEVWDPAGRRLLTQFQPNRGEDGADGADIEGGRFFVQRLAGGRTAGGSPFVVAGTTFEGLLTLHDLATGRSRPLPSVHYVRGLAVASRRDGTPVVLLAGEGRQPGFGAGPSSLPGTADLPVEVRFLPVAAALCTVPGAPEQVLWSGSMLGRSPIRLWDTARDGFADLPLSADLGYDGTLAVLPGPGGARQLVSITGRNNRVTFCQITEGPREFDHQPPMPYVPARTSLSAVPDLRDPGSAGSPGAFAIRSESGEFAVRDARGGRRLPAPSRWSPGGAVLTVAGRGPYLVQTAEEGWLPWHPERDPAPPPRGLAPLMGTDAVAVSAGPGLLVAHAAAPGTVDCLIWGNPPLRYASWRLPNGSYAQLTALRRPDGTGLIAAWTPSTTTSEYRQGVLTLLDPEQPDRPWSLEPGVLRSGAEVALLPTPRPLLATVADGYHILLWDPASRRRVGALPRGTDQVRAVTDLVAGTAARPLLAASYADGSLRLWDPSHRDRPLVAELWIDLVAERMAPLGSTLCLVNEEGTLCLDLGALD